MKKQIFVVILFSLSINTYGQVKKNSSLLEINKFSFFDNDLANKIKISTRDNQLQMDYNFLKDFYDLGDSIYYLGLNSRIIDFRRNSEKPSYLDVSYPQLLSDSVMIHSTARGLTPEKGNILNFRNKSNIQYEMDKKILPTYLELNYNRNILFTHQLIKSDIFTTGGILYNLLSNKRKYLNESLGKIIDNPSSKYIYLQKNGLLINRFDVNDNIIISSAKEINNIDYSWHYYNDSSIYIPMNLWNSYKTDITKFKLNEVIDIDLKSFIDSLGNRSSKYSQETFYNRVKYFYNKYSKIDISNQDESDIRNRISIYKNIVNNNQEIGPTVIIEYNIFSDRVTAILDKNVSPFFTIEKILCDKNNRFLIISDKKQFTVFDLKTKKEIITLEGRISHINSKNELIFNVLAEFGYNNLKFCSLNMNELLINSFSKFIHDDFQPLKIDEFTTKNEFVEKLDKLMTSLNKPLVRNIIYENNKQLNTSNNFNYSNNTINNKIILSLDKYFNNTKKFINNDEFLLSYKFYDSEKKEVSFSIQRLSDTLVWMFNIINDQSAWHNNNLQTFILRDISVEDAKKMKNSTCKLLFKRMSNQYAFPSLTTLLFSNFLDSDEPKIGISPYQIDDNLRDRISIYINYCVLKIDGVDYKILSKKYLSD